MTRLVRAWCIGSAGGRGVKEELSFGVPGANLAAHNFALHKTPNADLPQDFIAF